MDEHFTFIGNQELNGILRGRSVPAARGEEALTNGLPWVPANITIGAFNSLPADNPFGPSGEIRLMPDRAARISLPQGRAPSFDLVLCDYTQRDGSPWSCCPRTALRAAVADLEVETGLTLLVALEHEFTVHGLEEPIHLAFSLSAGRAGGQLAENVIGILDTGGFTLDQFVAEFGDSQYEIAGQPTDPLAAADRTVLTLETIRAAARDLGLRASFLPKPHPSAVGNGVHVHFSLWRDGQNVTLEKTWVSPEIESFLSGVLNGAEPLTFLSNTTTNSYARYRPQSWVGAYVCAGLMNREAMVRVVPRQMAADGSHPGATLEFRISDATANVYLMLAALIRAGLDGVRSGRQKVSNIEQDPETFGQARRDELRLRHMPTSLSELLTDKVVEKVTNWLGDDLGRAYASCRRNDLKHVQQSDEEAVNKRLSLVY